MGLCSVAPSLSSRPDMASSASAREKAPRRGLSANPIRDRIQQILAGYLDTRTKSKKRVRVRTPVQTAMDEARALLQASDAVRAHLGIFVAGWDGDRTWADVPAIVFRDDRASAEGGATVTLFFAADMSGLQLAATLDVRAALAGKKRKGPEVSRALATLTARARVCAPASTSSPPAGSSSTTRWISTAARTSASATRRR